MIVRRTMMGRRMGEEEEEEEEKGESATYSPRVQDLEELAQDEIEDSTFKSAEDGISNVELGQVAQDGSIGEEERKEGSAAVDSRQSSRGSKRDKSRGSSRESNRSTKTSSSVSSDGSDTTEAYSISTGTYTSRTGWSQADDWSPPPTWRSDDSWSSNRSKSDKGGGLNESKGTDEGEEGKGNEEKEGEDKEGGQSTSIASEHDPEITNEDSRSYEASQMTHDYEEKEKMEDDIKEDSHVDARGLPSLSRQSSTTLSSDSSATSVVLSSSEIYNRIAYSRPSTGSSSMYSSSSYTDSYYYGDTRLARGVPTTAITATPPVAVEAVAFPLVPHVVEVTLMTTMMETLSDNIEESTAMIQKILEQVIAPFTPTMMNRSHPQVERVKEVPCRVVAL